MASIVESRLLCEWKCLVMIDFFEKRKGQSLAEYALIGGLIIVVAFVGMQVLGDNLSTMMNETATTIANTLSGG